MSAIPRYRQTEIVAFRLWLEHGCDADSPNTYWREAEQVIARIGTSTSGLRTMQTSQQAHRPGKPGARHR